VLQPVNFAFDVPNRFAQVLYWLAFLLVPQQVLERIADAEVFVLAKFYCFNPRWMGCIVRWMVYWVHARSLAKLALLSTVCFSSKAQTPLFHEVTNNPSQALPVHHLANCGGGTISVRSPK
jgi:hypothetical protein